MLENNKNFVSLGGVKQFALFVFLLAAVFLGSMTAARHLAVEHEAVGEPLPFAPANFSLVHRPFTVVIVGFNNGGAVPKTIASVLNQTYDNFRVVYIDDASNDGSFDVARDAIYESDHLAHVTLVRNEERLGVLANIYRAVIALPDNEIVVILDGEDLLAHEWVLERLNAYYDDPNLWISLAQGVDYPSFERSEPVNGLGVHLKSFYAALFKKIRGGDLARSGTFLKTGAESMYMTPMLEMAKHHFAFIPEVLIVNRRDPQVDREEVLNIDQYIRAQDPYDPLTTLLELPCGE